MTLQIFLLTYFLIYFGVVFLGKSWLIAKKINKSPLVLPKDESAYGLIGRYFKLTLLALFVYVLLYAFIDEHIFLPISYFQNDIFRCAGISLLLASLIWTIVAQNHMKDSWRIGIDKEKETQLIINGLFSISRNPIFLGMIVSLLGLLLSTPNALTLLFLLVGYILIQIQIRLEEELLIRQHGAEYVLYQQKTKRLI